MKVQKLRGKSQFVKACDAIALKFPELVSKLFTTKDDQNDGEKKSGINTSQFLRENKLLICQMLTESENEIFKNVLMPLVYRKHCNEFTKFASGLVGSLCVSQRDTQDVLRNT